MDPVVLAVPRNRESIDRLGARRPVPRVEAPKDMVVAVDEAIDGMGPKRRSRLPIKAAVGAVAQLARVVRLLILLTRHTGPAVLKVSLGGRLIHGEDLPVEVEVSHRVVVVLRACVSVGEVRALTVDLMQDDLVANTTRYEGVKGARSCPKSASTGASTLGALREGAAHRRKRRREGE